MAASVLRKFKIPSKMSGPVKAKCKHLEMFFLGTQKTAVIFVSHMKVNK